MSINYREFNPNLDHTQVAEVTDFLDAIYRKYTDNEDRLGRSGLKRIAETICTYPDEFIEFITKLSCKDDDDEDDDEKDDEDDDEKDDDEKDDDEKDDDEKDDDEKDDDEAEEEDDADDDDADDDDDNEVDEDEVDEADSTDALKEEGIKPINEWSWIWIQGIYQKKLCVDKRAYYK